LFEGVEIGLLRSSHVCEDTLLWSLIDIPSSSPFTLKFVFNRQKHFLCVSFGWGGGMVPYISTKSQFFFHFCLLGSAERVEKQG
jgi:hypothetical protein